MTKTNNSTARYAKVSHEQFDYTETAATATPGTGGRRFCKPKMIGMLLALAVPMVLPLQVCWGAYATSITIDESSVPEGLQIRWKKGPSYSNAGGELIMNSEGEAVVCPYGESLVEAKNIPSFITISVWDYLRDSNGYADETHEKVCCGKRNVPVTSISFSGCSSLQNVIIPSSITSIDFRNCSSLQNVTIPSSVTSIGSEAFRNCTSLQSMSIPDSVTSIGSYAFSGCSSLQSVSIPFGVTAISNRTFYGCTSLSSVTIPNSVKEIQTSAFYGCGSLAEVAIPASVTEIALDAFKSCDGIQRFVVDPENPVYASYDGALYTKDLKALIFYPGGRTDVKLPSGTVATKEDAFTGCGKLWTEWYRMFQKTRYDLTNKMEDRAIATLTVDKDTALDGFVLRDGKAYDAVIYISNTSAGSIRLTLPNGYTYKCFKGASPLTIPGNSQNILSITRVSDTVFLVSREELENAR